MGYRFLHSSQLAPTDKRMSEEGGAAPVDAPVDAGGDAAGSSEHAENVSANDDGAVTAELDAQASGDGDSAPAKGDESVVSLDDAATGAEHDAVSSAVVDNDVVADAEADDTAAAAVADAAAAAAADIDAATAAADGDDVVPAAEEETPGVDRSDETSEPLAAAPAPEVAESNDALVSAAQPVPDAPASEDPVSAPIKSKGSAQYPLAELTRNGELPYYTPAQVAAHAVAADCWLSLLGKVIDVTNLVRCEHPELMQSIVNAAGTDVSHWFDRSGELKMVHDVKSGLRRYQTPGDLPLLHAPSQRPDSSFDMSFGEPWWRQEQLVVGTLTQKTRKLRVVNMLLSTSHVIDVCTEQKICDINDLYRSYNAHAGSYTWKRLNKHGKMEVLDYNKTLQDNELPDMSAELAELLIDEVRSKALQIVVW